MNQALLDAVTIGPADAQFSVIWLHGLGADGHDFEPIVPELNFNNRQRTRFIFPHAPARPVTLNQGYVMPAWFDIVAIDAESEQDEAGIRASAERISALIAREQERGVRAENIVLAGFSQGGAIALHLGLRYPQRLAGILALSSFLPLADKLAGELSDVNRDIPIYMAHGQHDPIVPIQLAQLSLQQLQALGYVVAWHLYPMEHSVCPAEIADISAWFERVLV
jgi:phospholipase/carboxylesterase